VFIKAIPVPGGNSKPVGKFLASSLYIVRFFSSHSEGYEEFCLQGYNGVLSVENPQTFRKNLFSPSSGSKTLREELKQNGKENISNEDG
jgi:hypothetical protein